MLNRWKFYEILLDVPTIAIDITRAFGIAHWAALSASVKVVLGWGVSSSLCAQLPKNSRAPLPCLLKYVLKCV